MKSSIISFGTSPTNLQQRILKDWICTLVAMKRTTLKLVVCPCVQQFHYPKLTLEAFHRLKTLIVSTTVTMNSRDCCSVLKVFPRSNCHCASNKNLCLLKNIISAIWDLVLFIVLIGKPITLTILIFVIKLEFM